jgi:tetratricopeptide (TPR) repeat protein
MSAGWYRNTTWDDAIERAFDEKLRRARSKEQYIRIQACTLASSHPEVSLKLLDRYFELNDDFDHAQAHVDRATALLSLGRIDQALAAYEAALAHETADPNVQTEAYIELPYLVAVRSIRNWCKRALEVLHLYESRPLFSIDHFRWHAAHAMIAAAIGEPETAGNHSALALEASSRRESGFRKHPSIGLVTKDYDDVVGKLKALCANVP